MKFPWNKSLFITQLLLLLLFLVCWFATQIYCVLSLFYLATLTQGPIVGLMTAVASTTFFYHYGRVLIIYFGEKIEASVAKGQKELNDLSKSSK